MILRAPTLDGNHLAPGRHKILDLHFTYGMFESASMDTDAPFDGEIVTCLIGITDDGDNTATGYSLLLKRSGSLYKRIGMLDTIYAPKRQDNNTRVIHGIEELDLKRHAPLRELTII